MSRRKVLKAAAGRKPSGQPGHAGTTREIVTPEHMDEVVDQDPEMCANCEAPLEKAPRINWDSLWTYVREDDAVPTNNEVERALRKAELWRKGSLGINSPAGALFVNRILTIAGTARRRGPDWLTRSIQANLNEYPCSRPGSRFRLK